MPSTLAQFEMRSDLLEHVAIRVATGVFGYTAVVVAYYRVPYSSNTHAAAAAEYVASVTHVFECLDAETLQYYALEVVYALRVSRWITRTTVECSDAYMAGRACAALRAVGIPCAVADATTDDNEAMQTFIREYTAGRVCMSHQVDEFTRSAVNEAVAVGNTTALVLRLLVHNVHVADADAQRRRCDACAEYSRDAIIA